jgi:hypothetical protein
MSKQKCNKCPKISQYTVDDSNFCVGCIPEEARKHASHTRMEYNILSDITRGLEKKYMRKDLNLKFDSVYHDKQRPDLSIRYTGSNDIIMVEVDEKQHFTEENKRKDRVRFDSFRANAKKYNHTLSVIRIVPNETDRNGNSMYKNTSNGVNKLQKPNGYIEKNPEKYNKYIKESVSKISRIIDNDMSYRYRGSEISIGPNQTRNIQSPIYSNTSSPDISPSFSRARAHFKDDIEDLIKNTSDLTISTRHQKSQKSIKNPELPEKTNIWPWIFSSNVFNRSNTQQYNTESYNIEYIQPKSKTSISRYGQKKTVYRKSN